MLSITAATFLIGEIMSTLHPDPPHSWVQCLKGLSKTKKTLTNCPPPPKKKSTYLLNPRKYGAEAPVAALVLFLIQSGHDRLACDPQRSRAVPVTSLLGV